MKRSTILPTLLATILCAGPVLAEPQSSETREQELALETQAQAVAGAATASQHQVERNLQNVERQLRIAQSQVGQTVAAAGPALRHAFGASFVNTPEPPLVVATSKLDATALAELREDLNVMTKLVDDAVADDHEDAATRSAMGIVVKWLPGVSVNNNLYVEGTGAIIQTSVRFPLMPPQKQETKPAAETPKNSAWESARRELYGGNKENDTEIVLPPDKQEEYSAERVENLKQAILKALANANNFRRLSDKETVTVVVRNRNAKRSEFVMFQYSDAHGRTQRSSKNDDSTMTVRVKKSDADALAAGKIKEEEFQKRAQVAIY